MFTVNNQAVNREGAQKVSDYEMGIFDKNKPSRLRSYNRYELEEHTETERAAQFNAQIKENYQRLITKTQDLKPESNAMDAEANFSRENEGVLNEQELIPSATTMQFIGMEKEEFELKSNSSERQQYKLTSKAKIMFVMYAVVVVLLFALIIINTRTLFALNTQINTMTSEIKFLTTESQTLTEELSARTSDEYVSKHARELLEMIENK